jgi:hypothetical protein
MIGDDAKVSCCKWRSIFISSLLAMGEGHLSTWRMPEMLQLKDFQIV